MKKNLLNIRFKEARKELCMTQQEFAETLEIKRSSVGAYEEGRALPSLEIMHKIILLLFFPKEKTYDFLFNPSYDITDELP